MLSVKAMYSYKSQMEQFGHSSSRSESLCGLMQIGMAMRHSETQ